MIYSAKWTSPSQEHVEAVIDGVAMTIPADPENRHYAMLIASGVAISAYVPPPLSVDDYVAAIEAHIDDVARHRSYSGAVSLASYVASTNASWAAEAQAFVGWRDAVWGYAYAEFAKVQSGVRAQPSVAEIVAELPEITWPT